MIGKNILFFFFRTASDVPLKIRDFTLIISDKKSLHKVYATKWAEIKDMKTEQLSSVECESCTDIMLQPSTYYRISFAGGQYQFKENSHLSVSIQKKIFSLKTVRSSLIN